MSIFLGKPSAKICDTLEKRYPKSPFTVNGTNYNTFKEALDAVNSSTAETNTLKVMKNVILDETETTTGAVLPLISKDVTIDFNGKKVVSHDVYSIDGNRFLKSTNAANVTIKNGTFEGDFICNVGNVWNGFFRQCSSGKFTLENANVSILNGKNCSAIKCQTGSVYVKGSTIKQRGASGCVGSEAAGAKVIVEDSTLEAIYDPNAIPGQIGAKDTICNTLNISDNAELSAINSTIRGINTMACVMSMSSGGNVMLSSCNIEYVRDGEVTDLAENGNGCCLYADQGGTVHATYKCYDCTMTHPGLATGQSASDHNLQMFYSTANSTTPAAGVANIFELDYGTFDKFNSLTLGDHLKFTIKNGTFRGNAEEFADAKFKPLIATGYVATKVSDTEYTVAIKPPIHIKSVADLQKLQAEVAAGDDKATETYLQDVDLDLTGIVWQGIGDKDTEKYFSGVYDGNNKSITNMTLYRKEYSGLFGFIKNATIKNLTVTCNGFDMASSTKSSFGGAVLVGYSYNSAILENITTNGTVGNTANHTTHNTGGLIARASLTDSSLVDTEIIKMTKCINNANVFTTRSSGHKQGGIVGYLEMIAQMTDCENHGSLTTNSTNVADQNGGIGGFIGNVSSAHNGKCSATITNGISDGEMNIPATSTAAGQIYGWLRNADHVYGTVYVKPDYRISGSGKGSLDTAFAYDDGTHTSLLRLEHKDDIVYGTNRVYKVMFDKVLSDVITLPSVGSYIIIDESLGGTVTVKYNGNIITGEVLDPSKPNIKKYVAPAA